MEASAGDSAAGGHNRGGGTAAPHRSSVGLAAFPGHHRHLLLDPSTAYSGWRGHLSLFDGGGKSGMVEQLNWSSIYASLLSLLPAFAFVAIFSLVVRVLQDQKERAERLLR